MSHAVHLIHCRPKYISRVSIVSGLVRASKSVTDMADHEPKAKGDDLFFRSTQHTGRWGEKCVAYKSDSKMLIL